MHKLKSISDAMNAKAPSVAQMKRDCGEEFSLGLLMAWLVYLNEFLNLNKPMNEAQIQLCAKHILQEFNHLKFSDLSYLFNKIITGQYGEFYESLSIAKVLTFFREYEQERTDLAIDQAEREHREFRYQESKNEGSIDILRRQTKKIRR